MKMMREIKLIFAGFFLLGAVVLASPGSWLLLSSAMAAIWGQITGTVSNQLDLQAVLDTKAPIASPTFTGTVTLPQVSYGGEYDNGSSGTSKTINWNNGTVQKMTMTGTCTVALSNPVASSTYTIRVIGNGSNSIVWPTSVIWEDGKNPAMNESTVTVVRLYYDGTNYRGSFAKSGYVNRRSMAFIGNAGTTTDLLYVSDFADNLRFERTDSFTVIAWIRQVSGGTYQVIIANNQSDVNTYRGWNLMLDNNNRVLFSVVNTLTTNDLSVRGDTALTANTWYRVAVSYDGSSTPGGVNIYLGDALENMTTVSNTLSATIVSTGNLAIGGRTVPENPFVGQGGNISVWNRVLNATEIGNTATSSKPNDLLTHSAVANLSAWWALDNLAGDRSDIIFDRSPNRNHGIPLARVVTAGINMYFSAARFTTTIP